MDFLIDEQISSFCPDQHESKLLTLIIQNKTIQKCLKSKFSSDILPLKYLLGQISIFQDPKRNVSVKGASVFCFNEPKCFRLRIRENHRQGKQQSEQKSSDQEIVYLKIQKDNGTEIHVEQVKNSGKEENRRARKGDRSKKRKRNRICPSLEVKFVLNEGCMFSEPKLLETLKFIL